MICPTNYTAKQHALSIKKHYSYAVHNSLTRLSYNVEHAIIRICEKEIQSVKCVEQTKQKIMS